MVGNHFGAGTAVVSADIFVARIVLKKVEIIQFALVHSPHRSTRHYADILQVVLLQTGIGDSLLQGKHTHKGSARHWNRLVDIQPLAHFVVGKFHFTDRKLVMLGLQVFQLSDTRTFLQQRTASFFLSYANRGYYSCACNPDLLHSYLVRFFEM